MRALPVTLSLALAACTVQPVVQDRAGSLSIERAGDSVTILAGDELFARVHLGDPMPYVYPLLGPGGVRVTRGFPMDPKPDEAHDHPHHRSLWFAHGAVNGHDFWHGSETRIVTEEVLSAHLEGDAAVLVTRNAWMAGEERIANETRTLRFSAGPGERTIELETELSPAGDEPLVFGDTKEGTMALRLHPALRLKGDVARGHARSSAGHENGDVWGQRAAWVSYTAPIDGRTITVTMHDHPDNLRHPTWWHARDYGLFAANPFGIHDFEGEPAGTGDHTVETGSALLLRYRIEIRDR